MLHYFEYFTYRDDAGRWYWQRAGRARTYDAPGFDTIGDARRAALECATRERVADQNEANARFHRERGDDAAADAWLNRAY